MNEQEQQEQQTPAPEEQQQTPTQSSSDNEVQAQLAAMKEEIDRLRDHKDKLLAEKKQEQEKARNAEEQARQEADAKAREEGNFKQLFESQEQKVADLEKQLAERDQATIAQQKNSEAAKLAANLTRDTGRADVLTEKIAQRIEFIDGKVRVKDEGGNLTVSTISDLQNEMSQKYPFLVDGSQAGGAGAQGNNAGHEAVQTQLSPEAQNAIKTGDNVAFLNAAFAQKLGQKG